MRSTTRHLSSFCFSSNCRVYLARPCLCSLGYSIHQHMKSLPRPQLMINTAVDITRSTTQHLSLCCFYSNFRVYLARHCQGSLRCAVHQPIKPCTPSVPRLRLMTNTAV